MKKRSFHKASKTKIYNTSEQALKTFESISLVFALALICSVLFLLFFPAEIPSSSKSSTVIVAICGLLCLLCHLGIRFSFIEKDEILNLGIGLEVFIIFAFSWMDYSTPITETTVLSSPTWVGVAIILFPIIVPIGIAKRVIISISAASLPIFVASALSPLVLSNPVPPKPKIYQIFITHYFYAAIAIAMAYQIQRWNRALMEARREISDLGSYQLVEKLGQGGMGEVWLAKHALLSRPAAVKLIKNNAINEVSRQRFEKEAQAIAFLTSPHTVQLYDFGVTDDGTLYYAMELLDGWDLAKMVQHFGSFKPQRAIHILRKVCMSLAEAHDAGLVHRDIKPANIVVGRQGGQHDFVKVLDFGLVFEQEQESAHRITQDGKIAGTPGFIAPEAIRSLYNETPAVDIYALGCVAWWILTGREVFPASSSIEKLIAHVEKEPEPPSRYADNKLPGGLDQIILKCLEKEPENRYQSTRDLENDLYKLCTTWSEQDAREWWDRYDIETPFHYSQSVIRW